MHLGLVTLLFTAIIVSWVESKCHDFHLSTADYNIICKKWWDDTEGRYYAISNEEVRNCMKLIEKRCPNMITITITPKNSRSHDGKKNYEIWSTTVKASLTTEINTWMTYDETERKPLCYDNGVEQCDFWWKIATTEKVEDEIKEVCINNIWKHCRSNIEKVSEGGTTEVTRCFRAYNVKVVTYKYNRKTTSFKQCVPEKKA